MATPRSRIVDESVTPFYHCVSRCVRKAFLCGEGVEHRKEWIENRLKDLVAIFAIDCAGYAIMDNHLHLLLRLDSRRAKGWTPEEAARRWLTLFPLRAVDGSPLPVSKSRVAELASDADRTAETRRKLVDLGWFMKCLKEPLARLANKEEGCTGAFWEGRFKSVAVLDEEALLATAAYIDLNPVAAGISAAPETSPHTSVHARVEHCRANGTLDTLRDDLSTQTHNPEQEKDLWLIPVDDRRDFGDARPGLIPGLTLSCYLRLVDWTSRLIREGKSRVSPEVGSIFERLKTDPAEWEVMMVWMLTRVKRSGCHFGGRERLRQTAQARGKRWHRNQVPLRPAPTAA